MFNVALINGSAIQDETYIEGLEEKDCCVHHMETVTSYEDLKEMDVIIIVESNSTHQISKTCESIIKIREVTNGLIWVLTGESTKLTRIIYMRLGCDRILNQRMDSDEFSLLVSLTLERQNQYTGIKRSKQEEQELQGNKDSGLTLIPNNISVSIDGKEEVNLTKLEFKALELLDKYKGEVITYNKIYEHIWGGENKDGQYRVANLVCHLRKKLEKDYKNPQHIKTVRSKGYKLSKQIAF